MINSSCLCGATKIPLFHILIIYKYNNQNIDLTRMILDKDKYNFALIIQY